MTDLYPAGLRVRYHFRDTGTVVRVQHAVPGRPECGTVVVVQFDATELTEPFTMSVPAVSLWPVE